MLKYGSLREDILLQPGSGKALPVYYGEVYRIVVEDEPQCVDCLCYNLHDYRERMSINLMRRQGFHLGKGDYVLSASPRNNLMMQILDKQDTNYVNVILHRCSAASIEAAWGIEDNINCQDMLAEAIREYGLTPDDTHGTLCPWTPTGWTDMGKTYHRRNNGAKGDYFDLLALMDVLFVSCVCGSNDLTPFGGYFQRPMRLQIFEPSEETKAIADKIHSRFPPLINQRTPEDGQGGDHELKKILDYIPQFKNYPLLFQTLEIEFTEMDYEQMNKMVESGMRENHEDAVRTAVIEWFRKNRRKYHPLCRGN